MPKLIDNHQSKEPIGNDGLLRFIDEINAIRARSGNRFRFEPSMHRETGILKMREHLAIPRHADPGTPSPLYSGHARIDAE